MGLILLLAIGLAIYFRNQAGAAMVRRTSDSQKDIPEAPDLASNIPPIDSPAGANVKKDSDSKWGFIAEQRRPEESTRHAKLSQLIDPRPTKYNSLPTGTSIGPDFCTGGHGVLTVENGTDVDAVARLYDAATYRTVCWFSIRAGESHRKAAIPQGTYALVYTTGLDWVDAEDTFRWHPSYSRFERILRYDEQEAAGDIQYHDISVTLQPVFGGNVRAQKISREEFLKGHRHMALER